MYSLLSSASTTLYACPMLVFDDVDRSFSVQSFFGVCRSVLMILVDFGENSFLRTFFSFFMLFLPVFSIRTLSNLR